MNAYKIGSKGWDEVGGRREVQQGGTYVCLWLIPLMFRNQHNSVKQVSSIK